MRSLGAALLLTLTGCGVLSGAPEFKDGDVTVVDEAGIVTAIEAPSGGESQSEGTPPTAERGASLTELVIGWSAPPCILRWKVIVAGNALTVRVEAGPSTNGCVAEPKNNITRRTATITLNRVIDAEAVDVEVVSAY